MGKTARVLIDSSALIEVLRNRAEDDLRGIVASAESLSRSVMCSSLAAPNAMKPASSRRTNTFALIGQAARPKSGVDGLSLKGKMGINHRGHREHRGKKIQDKIAPSDGCDTAAAEVQRAAGSEVDDEAVTIGSRAAAAHHDRAVAAGVVAEVASGVGAYPQAITSSVAVCHLVSHQRKENRRNSCRC